MKRYKLTNQDMQTHNGFKWKIGKWYKTSGEGELCSEGWLHCYCDPNLAILHNPIHADISDPMLFEVDVRGECKTDKQMKEGWTEMRLVKAIPIPEITTEQRIKYAILCATEIYQDEDFMEWALLWWSGVDRSADAARAAWAAVWAATRAVVWAAAAEAAVWTANVDLAALAEIAISDKSEIKWEE